MSSGTAAGDPSSVALVFGATGAIGSELCRRLAARGTRLALVARDENRLAELREELRGAEAFACDVTSAEAVADAYARVAASLGTPTLVAHCVGSILLKAAHQLRDAEWDETLRLNLSSAFYALRGATTLWTRAQTPGSIVFCSTAAATVGLANHEAIAAAKAGLEGLVRSAAATYASRGIRVNAVAPGLVRTPLSARITASEAALKASVAMHPLRRIGEPGHVASALAWLLDSEQDWVTGQVIGVDGGLARLKTIATGS